MIILEAANLFALNYAHTIPPEIRLYEDNIGIKKHKIYRLLDFVIICQNICIKLIDVINKIQASLYDNTVGLVLHDSNLIYFI